MAVNEGIVNRTGCFNYLSNHNCCYNPHVIRVKNCNDYFVYQLTTKATCNPHTRYCISNLSEYKFLFVAILDKFNIAIYNR